MTHRLPSARRPRQPLRHPPHQSRAPLGRHPLHRSLPHRPPGRSHRRPVRLVLPLPRPRRHLRHHPPPPRPALPPRPPCPPPPHPPTTRPPHPPLYLSRHPPER